MPHADPPPPEPEGQGAPGTDTEADRRRREVERGVYRRRTEADKAAEEAFHHRRAGDGPRPKRG